MSDLPIAFLRPWWLLGLVPLFFLAVYFLQEPLSGSAWDSFIDERLRSYVIEPGLTRTSRWRWLLIVAWLIALLAMSGPVWHKQQVPVFQGQKAQVILFDLSRSMLTDDIKPSRIVRARFKLLDFLQRASAIQVALIAFAERPYVISPLSDDANTIASFVDSLDPSIMPAQGSRIDLAIDQGVSLLEQAGISNGQLVVFTDSTVNAKDIGAAQAVREAGHRLSVIGVGTRAGAPLRSENGQFLQDSSGAIVVPQLNEAGLVQLASAGGGRYTKMSNDDQDLNTIDRVQEQLAISGDVSTQQDTNEYWVEYAPYAVIVLLVFALLQFRRGVVW